MANQYVLAADIGGTNTQIGVFDARLRQLQYGASSTRHVHPYEAIRFAAGKARKSGLRISAAVIAVAGPVKDGKVHLTNAGISLSMDAIKKVLKTKNVAMINDFEAVAYGVNVLKKNDILPLTGNRPLQKGVKVVLGAGTGLGKAVLYWDEQRGMYVPLRAEEGHTAIAAMEKEFPLVRFIRKRKKQGVVWEDVLSGRGLATIYDFVSEKRRIRNAISREIAGAADKASAIAEHRKTDGACREAFALFTRIYARFIHTSMLSALPYGGVYIAGGIARKNPDVFSSKGFRDELYGKGVYADIVKKIPLFIITDAQVGLKGAAYCALRR